MMEPRVTMRVLVPVPGSDEVAKRMIDAMSAKMKLANRRRNKAARRSRRINRRRK